MSNFNLKDYFNMDHPKKLLLIIAGVILFFLVFSVGVFVGAEKARFSYRWGENYFRNFVGGPGFGPRMMPEDRGYFNAHGVFGDVVKITANIIIIKGSDNVERTVVTNSRTEIREFDRSLKVSDLKAGDKIVIIGSPDTQGQIEAKIIRLLPAGNGPFDLPGQKYNSNNLGSSTPQENLK